MLVWSNTVEQIGTEGYSEGAVGYDAWYEMYPDYPVTIGMSIHPGDVLTGTVTWSKPAYFTLSLVDHTTSSTFTTTLFMSVPPALASGEVIAEVIACEFSGPTSLVTMRLDAGGTLRSRRLGPPAVAPGDRVTVARNVGPAVVFTPGGGVT